MKKRVFLIWFAVLTLGFTGFGQIDLSIQTIDDAQPGGTIDIAVTTAGDLNGIGGIQLAIQFDNLSVFTGEPVVANKNASINQGFQWNYDESIDQLLISWAKPNISGPAINLVAGTKLFDIRIQYVNGDSDIDFVGEDNYIYNDVFPFSQFNLNWVNGNISQQRYTISGKLKYANPTGAVRPITNSSVHLKTADGLTILQTVSTDGNGDYIIEGVLPGEYVVTGSTTKPWGGFNSFDDIRFRNHIGGTQPLTGLPLLAADVDNSGFVNSFDGIRIKNRISSGSIVGWNRPEWNFENHLIVITNNNISIDIKGICTGDLNTSYNPSL